MVSFGAQFDRIFFRSHGTHPLSMRGVDLFRLKEKLWRICVIHIDFALIEVNRLPSMTKAQPLSIGGMQSYENIQ